VGAVWCLPLLLLLLLITLALALLAKGHSEQCSQCGTYKRLDVKTRQPKMHTVAMFV